MALLLVRILASTLGRVDTTKLAKKTLFHPKEDCLSRLLFQLKIFRYEFIEKRPIIYIDESGFAVDSPREYGYNLKGERCYPRARTHFRISSTLNPIEKKGYKLKLLDVNKTIHLMNCFLC